MSAAAFDTLRIARDLEAAGIERRQAEALRTVAQSARAESATKADLEAAVSGLEVRLRSDLSSKADLETAVSGLEARLRSDLASKADLAELRDATKADLEAVIAEVRIATRADLAAVRSELGTVRWAIGLLAAFVFAIGLRIFGLI